MRVVMTAVRPPAITNIAAPSLRSWRSWRTLERRLACENVVSVPRQSVSEIGQVIETTIVPRLVCGLGSCGWGGGVAGPDEPAVGAGPPPAMPPPALDPVGGVVTGTTASSSEIVA